MPREIAPKFDTVAKFLKDFSTMTYNHKLYAMNVVPTTPTILDWNVNPAKDTDQGQPTTNRLSSIEDVPITKEPFLDTTQGQPTINRMSSVEASPTTIGPLPLSLTGATTPTKTETETAPVTKPQAAISPQPTLAESTTPKDEPSSKMEVKSALSEPFMDPATKLFRAWQTVLRLDPTIRPMVPRQEPIQQVASYRTVAPLDNGLHSTVLIQQTSRAEKSPTVQRLMQKLLRDMPSAVSNVAILPPETSTSTERSEMEIGDADGNVIRLVRETGDTWRTASAPSSEPESEPTRHKEQMEMVPEQSPKIKAPTIRDILDAPLAHIPKDSLYPVEHSPIIPLTTPVTVSVPINEDTTMQEILDTVQGPKDTEQKQKRVSGDDRSMQPVVRISRYLGLRRKRKIESTSATGEGKCNSSQKEEPKNNSSPLVGPRGNRPRGRPRKNPRPVQRKVEQPDNTKEQQPDSTEKDLK